MITLKKTRTTKLKQYCSIMFLYVNTNQYPYGTGNPSTIYRMYKPKLHTTLRKMNDNISIDSIEEKKGKGNQKLKP